MTTTEDRTTRRERIVAALAALQQDDGSLDPAVVVEAARDPASPLHDAFDWNVETAAYEWWLSQARSLIRSVEVELTITRRQVTVVGYVHDERLGPRERGYVPTQAVQPLGLEDATLAREMKRIESAITRARNIADAIGERQEFNKRLRALLR